MLCTTKATMMDEFHLPHIQAIALKIKHEQKIVVLKSLSSENHRIESLINFFEILD